MAKKQRKKRLPQIAGELNQKLLENASKSNNEILETFHSSISGINQANYAKLKEQYGPNTIGGHKQYQWYHSLFEAIFNPFSIILIIIAILDVAIPEMHD
jgi:magnesium-transporting ATPase (P-type)